jgi:endonuclease/exonuclease/phosphatase family metal-dependent hydrolase
VRLRVVSYNVHGLRDDRQALASVVRGLRPDVVIVQEAPRRFRWRQRCADLAHEWGMLYAAGGLPSLGNLIVTSLRVQVEVAHHLQYPLTPGRHMRGAAFARCSVEGVEFVVAGTHLSTDDTERPGQARLFRDALVVERPPVVCGLDVNESSDGPSWRLLAKGRVDAAVESAATDWNTYPSRAPSRRLDAVLVDPRFVVERYEVPESDAVRAASDHLPVVVDLLLPDSETERLSLRTGE